MTQNQRIHVLQSQCGYSLWEALIGAGCDIKEFIGALLSGCHGDERKFSRLISISTQRPSAQMDHRYVDWDALKAWNAAENLARLAQGGRS